MKTQTTQKTSLRAAQVRVLKALAGGPKTRKQLAEECKRDLAWLVYDLGSSDVDKRIAGNAQYYTSLLTLDLVKVDYQKGGAMYSLSAKGRKMVKRMK